MPESTPPPVAALAQTAAASGALGAANLVKRQQLLASVQARPSRLVVVTGTGVTLQSVGHPAPGTDVASWPGLLANGLQRCRAAHLIDEDDAKVVEFLIQQKKSDYFIQAASKIHESLDKQSNGRLWWMKESIGRLKVSDPRLIKAILALNGLVATLNYDTTINQVSGLPALHWKQQNEIDKRINDRDFTLHLHGCVDDIESIILDHKSYEMISNHEQMHDLLRRFSRWETMLFIGCRQTFLDPNFQALLSWAQKGLLGLEARHFVLCRSGEEIDILKELRDHGYLTTLVYGDDHADLAPFLEQLATDAFGVTAYANPPTLPKAPVTPPSSNVRKPAELWKLLSRR